MTDRIAALTREGTLSSIENCTEVFVFNKVNGSWKVTEIVPFVLEGGNSTEIRDCMRSLILDLSGCSVLVGTSVAGIPYHVLDRMGFSIFEAEALSDHLLDGLLDDITQSEGELSAQQTPAEPVPLDDEGRWFLDLVALQEKHPEISSKQALRPFLKKKQFLELILICTHLPPFLEQELPEKHLGYAIETRADGQCKITISRVLCKE